MSMHTLFLRLHGPMQSWGSESKLHIKSVGDFPTRSSVLGLVTAAMGISREETDRLSQFQGLMYAACELERGYVERDFQTVMNVVSVDTGKLKPHAVLTYRWYRCGASYLAMLEGEKPLLQDIQEALLKPHWPLFLGRKSHVPSRPIAFESGVWQGGIDRFVEPKVGERIRCLRQLPGPEHMRGVGDSTLYDDPLDYANREFGLAYYRTDYVLVNKDVLDECQNGRRAKAFPRKESDHE